MQRNPSHLGSNSSPASWGTSCTALASIGFTGGITGRSTGSTVPRTRTCSSHGRRRHPCEAAIRQADAARCTCSDEATATVGGESFRADRRGATHAQLDSRQAAAHQVRGGAPDGAALAGRVAAARRERMGAVSDEEALRRRATLMVGIARRSPRCMGGTARPAERCLERRCGREQSWCRAFSEPRSTLAARLGEHDGRPRGLDGRRRADGPRRAPRLSWPALHGTGAAARGSTLVVDSADG